MRIFKLSSLRTWRSGVATVECSILLPLLLFLFLVGVDFSRVFYFSIAVTNCARNGAMYGSKDPSKALDQTGIKNAVLIDAHNLNQDMMTISSATDSNTAPTYVEVTVVYPFQTTTGFLGLPGTFTITRSVRMQVSPLVPN